MTYCVIPGCPKPQNPDTANICQTCGSKVLLRERYRPIQPIGQGGFGRTFLAVDEDIPSKPWCVVKQLYFEQHTSSFHKAVELFHQEAVRLDELGQHPQIPTLVAHFEQNRWLYLVQEFIEGHTLAQELKQKGSLNETQILQVLRDLLPVLKFIHSRQVIHRDIKPANIIRRTPSQSLPYQGGERGGQLVLIDFGIAKLFTGTAMLQTGTIIGSPEYMAPEQTRGKTLPASDLYSLGVTCIHLLTGVSPSNLFDISDDRWVWRNFLPPGTSVSDRLGNVLDKLLQNAVSLRYKSASEVLIDLKPQAKLAIAERTANGRSRSKLIPPAKPAPKIPNLTNFLANLFSGFGGQSRQRVQSDILRSEVGIDYTTLRDLLAAKKWKEADEETRAVLCQTIGKPSRGYLYTNDIEQLPCEDLHTIDRLWVKYSDGRFGFSVQSRIYEGSGEDYGSFCYQVGWETSNSNVPYYGVKFKQSAPVGHLPYRTWAAGMQWWRHAGAIASRLASCDRLP